MSLSEMIFMQDGASAHTARTTSKWLEDHKINFWRKEEWPPNSPDLNLIENLWSILEETIKDRKVEPQSLRQLETALLKSWDKIKLESLENLYMSMPARVKDVVRCKGDYPVK